jgi:hypothetical protein
MGSEIGIDVVHIAVTGWRVVLDNTWLQIDKAWACSRHESIAKQLEN